VAEISRRPGARIAVLHGSGASASAREILLACGQDYDPVFLISNRDPDGERLADLLSRIASVAPTDDEGPVATARRVGATAVTTFNDQYVTAVEDVASALGLPGASAQPECWDKLRQRELLDAAGASMIQVRPVASLADFTQARDAIGPVGILKPRRSSTSRGVRIVAGGERSSSVWDEMTARYGAGPLSGYLYEQLMDDGGGDGWLAPFVSVDTVSRSDARCHFGLFDKLPLLRSYIETGHLGPTTLAEPVRAQVLGVVDKALDALGVSDRVTHTEVRLTSAGPQVIEVNGRLGGYVQGLSAALSKGDPVRCALDIAAGTRPAVPELPGTRPGGHCAGALTLPLATRSATLAWKAVGRLRVHPLVTAVHIPSALDSSLSYACAWVEAPTRGTLLTGISAMIREACAEPAIHDSIDTDWLRIVTTPPPRLVES
jgi:hypothetical protein